MDRQILSLKKEYRYLIGQKNQLTTQLIEIKLAFAADFAIVDTEYNWDSMVIKWIINAPNDNFEAFKVLYNKYSHIMSQLADIKQKMEQLVRRVEMLLKKESGPYDIEEKKA